MKHLIIFIFIILTISAISQPKWQRVGDSLAVDILREHEVVDGKYVALISRWDTRDSYWNPGFIYFSKDTAKTWEKILLADTTIDTNNIIKFYKEILISMSYPDTNFCIVTGNDMLTFTSVDNLKSWNKSNDTTSGHQINKVKFWNNKIGILVTKEVLTNGAWQWYIQKTSDGGKSWNIINNKNNDSILRNPKYNPIMNLRLIDSNTIFTNQTLLKMYPPYRFLLSKDLGETWEYWNDENPDIMGPIILSPTKSLGIRNRLIDEDTGEYIVEIFMSNYYGKNYQKIYEIRDNFKNAFHAWDFCDSINGIAVTIDRVYRTTDGGESWFRDNYLKSEDFSETFREVKLINPNVALLFGQNNLYRIDYKQTGNVTVYETIETQILTMNINLLELNKYTSCTDNQYNNYKIYNYNGELIESNNLNNCNILLTNLPNGIYLIEISNLSKILKLKVNLYRN